MGKTPSNFKNMTGQRFGRLTVLSKGETERKNGQWRTTWRCKCDCGNEVVVKASYLREGRTTSCGCYKKEVLKKNQDSFKKPFRNTRLYQIWCDIKYRCYNPKKNNNYDYYYKKGIKMCDEWKDDFISFYEWSMSHGYQDGLTIDRIDWNKDYSPDNCRWTNWIGQANNKSTNHFIVFYGEKHTIAEWSRILNKPYSTLFTRINRGWDIERAFTTP